MQFCWLRNMPYEMLSTYCNAFLVTEVPTMQEYEQHKLNNDKHLTGYFGTLVEK